MLAKPKIWFTQGRLARKQNPERHADQKRNANRNSNQKQMLQRQC